MENQVFRVKRERLFTVCACGRKATVNARIDGAGRIVTEGSQVMLGGNDSYIARCLPRRRR